MRADVWMFLAGLGLGACNVAETKGTSSSSTGGPECTTNSECPSADAPFCDAAGRCASPPRGALIGTGDGSAGSVTLTVILEPDAPRSSTDLAFHPDRPELWVSNYQDDSVFIITNPGAETATWTRKHDPDAQHFMHKPPAIAFGESDTFGTCGDGDNGDAFMGPALFSADPAIFAKATSGGLGSHIDMLHSTSFCRGIAHQDANIFWTFNSDLGSIDKYDFHKPHAPGAEDHSDGEIFRYVSGQVAGVAGTPSHLVYRSEDKALYIVDTGHQRVAKLDTTTGSLGKVFSGDEPVKRHMMDGANLVDVVPAGTLSKPVGIDIADGIIYVSDAESSLLYAFGLDGELLRSLDTGLAPGSLAGIAVGPDAKLYFVDRLTSRVYRVDP